MTTAVGYAGGTTPNPTYEEVCSERTGHAEVVLVAYDPTKITYEQLLKTFWEAPRPDPGHAPGQRPRHQLPLDHPRRRRRAAARRRGLEGDVPEQLSAKGYGTITTEIVDAGCDPFYYAEDYHQQYLDKNPRGYCPNHSTGVKLPDDFVVTPLQYVD